MELVACAQFARLAGTLARLAGLVDRCGRLVVVMMMMLLLVILDHRS